MKRRSLAWILARQWVIFTLSVALLISAAALLLLFVLEDSFIDRRLREVARQDAVAARGPPVGFAVYPADALPPELRARAAGLAAGDVREFWLPDGRYVHVLATTGSGGARRLWVHDATGELTVSSGLALLAPGLLVALALLALLAWALARRFIGQISRRAQALVALAGAADSPEELRRQAREESIHELAELAERISAAWQQHSEVLQREQQTLAYLAHELRTPLQSARTSLAQLGEGPLRPDLLARLRRAVDRLVRATDGVLWLTSSADPRAQSTDLAVLLESMVQTFEPLAAAQKQSIRLLIASSQRWPGPESALGVVMGNLLLNAIQHGGPGCIVIRAGADCVEICNPAPPASGSGGFGLGLEVVDRLCRRCGWTLLRHRQAGVDCSSVFAAGSSRLGSGTVPDDAG